MPTLQSAKRKKKPPQHTTPLPMAISPEYQQWCQDSGIKLHGIQAAFVQHGWRGVVATQSIEPGQAILEVPEQLLMTRRSAMQDPRLRAAVERHPGLTSEQVLGVHLLHELARCQAPASAAASTSQLSTSSSDGPDPISGAGGVSRWRLYLEHLPRSYTTLCNWSEEEIEALQLEHAKEAAEGAVEAARQQWQGVARLLKELGLPRKFLGLPAWLWATSTLMSRTMYVPFDSAGALTPFGDLHNYTPPAAPFTPDVLKGLTQLPQPSPPHQGQELQQQQQQQQQQEQQQQEQGGIQGLQEVAEAGCAEGIHAGGRSDADMMQTQQGREDDLLLAHAKRSMAASASCHRAGETTGPEANLRQDAKGDTSEASPGQSMTSVNEEQRQRPQPGCSPESVGQAAGGSGAISGSNESASAPVEAIVRPGLGGAGCAAGTPGDRGVLQEAAGSGDLEPGLEAKVEDASTSGDGGDGHYDEDAGVYRLVSRARYRPGDQVFLCYGRHHNLHLLQHYGFLLDDNPHEEVLLPLLLLEEAVTAGGRAGRQWSGVVAALLAQEDCFLHANGQPSWGLLRVLRTLAEPPSERRKCGHLLAAGERVSVAGELRAVLWLRLACARHLQSMPTRVEEDTELLGRWTAAAHACQDGKSEAAAGGADDTDQGARQAEAEGNDRQEPEPNPKLLLAVQWRACQKRILLQAVHMLDRCMALLDAMLPKDEADQILGRGRFRRGAPGNTK